MITTIKNSMMGRITMMVQVLEAIAMHSILILVPLPMMIAMMRLDKNILLLELMSLSYQEVMMTQ